MGTMLEDTTVRDELARDRTIMANERTLLAYARTSLGLTGLAVIIFKFGDQLTSILFGSLALAAAALVSFWGVRSYRLVATRLEADTNSDEGRHYLLEVD